MGENDTKHADDSRADSRHRAAPHLLTARRTQHLRRDHRERRTRHVRASGMHKRSMPTTRGPTADIARPQPSPHLGDDYDDALTTRTGRNAYAASTMRVSHGTHARQNTLMTNNVDPRGVGRQRDPASPSVSTRP